MSNWPVIQFAMAMPTLATPLSCSRLLDEILSKSPIPQLLRIWWQSKYNTCDELSTRTRYDNSLREAHINQKYFGLLNINIIIQTYSLIDCCIKKIIFILLPRSSKLNLSCIQPLQVIMFSMLISCSRLKTIYAVSGQLRHVTMHVLINCIKCIKLKGIWYCNISSSP